MNSEANNPTLLRLLNDLFTSETTQLKRDHIYQLDSLLGFLNQNSYSYIIEGFIKQLTTEGKRDNQCLTLLEAYVNNFDEFASEPVGKRLESITNLVITKLDKATLSRTREFTFKALWEYAHPIIASKENIRLTEAIQHLALAEKFAQKHVNNDGPHNGFPELLLIMGIEKSLTALYKPDYRGVTETDSTLNNAKIDNVSLYDGAYLDTPIGLWLVWLSAWYACRRSEKLQPTIDKLIKQLPFHQVDGRNTNLFSEISSCIYWVLNSSNLILNSYSTSSSKGISHEGLLIRVLDNTLKKLAGDASDAETSKQAILSWMKVNIQLLTNNLYENNTTNDIKYLTRALFYKLLKLFELELERLSEIDTDTERRITQSYEGLLRDLGIPKKAGVVPVSDPLNPEASFQLSLASTDAVLFAESVWAVYRRGLTNLTQVNEKRSSSSTNPSTPDEFTKDPALVYALTTTLRNVEQYAYSRSELLDLHVRIKTVLEKSNVSDTTRNRVTKFVRLMAYTGCIRLGFELELDRFERKVGNNPIEVERKIYEVLQKVANTSNPTTHKRKELGLNLLNWANTSRELSELHPLYTALVRLVVDTLVSPPPYRHLG